MELENEISAEYAALGRQAMTDGPRAVRKSELAALRALTDTVFRPRMPEQYPQLFNNDNLDNLRVCFDGNTCTSHVGMIQRDALLMGCTIRVCCIGAVCTHPDYRNQGLASACFNDAAEKARCDGVDVMIVSGSRSLYNRNGCLHLGRDFRVRVTTDAARSIDGCPITLKPALDGNPDLVAECYRREPVRFVRPPADYDFFFQSGWAMNSPSEILMIHTLAPNNRAGAFLGYVILRKPDTKSSSSLVEFGGDRHAVLAAIPKLMQQYGLEELSFQVMGSDYLMAALCDRAGLELNPISASGTIKLINFPQLMRRMKPRFAEILGSETADLIKFEQEADTYTFEFEKERLDLDRDTATRAVFGDPSGIPQEVQNGTRQLGMVLRRILPLPSLWYGINYV